MDVGRTFGTLMPDGMSDADERARYLAGLVKAHLRKRGDGREVRPLLPGMVVGQEGQPSDAGKRMRMMAGAPTAGSAGGGAAQVHRQRLMANRYGPQ